MKVDKTLIEHWYFHFEDLQLSSDELYEKIEQEIERRQYPNIHCFRTSFGRFFTGYREYLLIQRAEYRFYVCAAPFGTSYFISWWLREGDGDFWDYLFGRPRKSIYKIDTELLFKDSIKRIVEATVDEVLKTHGLKALSPEQYRPEAYNH